MSSRARSKLGANVGGLGAKAREHGLGRDGASRPEQVAQNVASLSKLQFSAEELSRIDVLTQSRSAR
jgi:hypothetical protein